MSVTIAKKLGEGAGYIADEGRPNGLRDVLLSLLNDLARHETRMNYGARQYPNIAQGTVAGRLRTNAAVTYTIGGQLYSKGSTDNLWNLSGLTTLIAAQYQATWLYVDNGGTASIAAGGIAASAAAAIQALPALVSTKSVLGVYVANPSCNYGNALNAQGTSYNGYPAAYVGTALGNLQTIRE